MDKDFRDYYQLPLRFHHRPGAVCINEVKAFDFIYRKLDLYTYFDFIDTINGDIPSRYTEMDVTYYCCEVMVNGAKFIRLRGWSELTRKYKLSKEEATKVQDDFGQYIVNKLKGI